MSRLKIIILDERVAKTGEPTVQPVLLWANGRPCRETLSKEASASPALDYITAVTPIPGRTIVLILGLGGFEFYGLNRNGDGFPEQPYKMGVKPTCGCCGHGRESWILQDECIQYHYKSYEHGHVFRHHSNKDPKRAVGKVLKAFWNSFMHRVEVLEDIENDKAPDLVERIADGEFPAKSMGCFLQGTDITTPSGCRQIQSLSQGEVVLSGKGHWRTITETHERLYRGTIYATHTATGTSTATAEHPYAVLKAETVEEYYQPKGYWRRRNPDTLSLDMTQWMHAECLQIGDYLVTPFDTEVRDTLTIDQCRLLGYYVSEGSLIYRNDELYGVRFDHHRDDAATTELLTLLGRLDPTLPVHQNGRDNSDVALYTETYNATLAKFCLQHCGCYASSKHLSLELMQQPCLQQLAFLGTWINGDGGDSRTGDFYISSCNNALISQAQLVGFRCSLYSHRDTIHHRASTVVDHATTEYRLNFARRGRNIIAPYTTKVAPRDLKSASTGPFFITGAVVSKIKEISSWHFEGTVYNFEVDEDESYVAGGHTVHNCRIKFDVCTKCGHMSPTRTQYCDHCKFELGVLDPHTGLRNGTLNPAPKFFDSSWVLRPADRTGYMLKKVAEHAYELQSSSELGELVDDLSAKAAAVRKLAVIDKIVRGYPAAVVQSELPEGHLIEQYRKEALPAAVKATPELKTADVQRLAQHDLPHTLAALSHAGIILTTPEFIRLFVEKAMPGTQVPEHVLDNLVALQSEVYNLLEQHPSMLNELLSVLTPEGTAPPSLQSTIAPMVEKRSMMSDYLRRRLVPSSFRMGEEPRSDMLEIQDPTTGRMFQTTRGAVFNAEDEIGKAQLKQLVGGAGMLGGAYKVLTSANPKWRLAALPLGLGGLHFGSKAFGDVPMYNTTSGDQVPYLTEFAEKRGNVLDIVNALGLDYCVTKIGATRLQRATSANSPMYPFMRKLGSFGLYNPEASLERLTHKQGKTASDGIREELLDLTHVANALGALAFELSGI